MDSKRLRELAGIKSRDQSEILEEHNESMEELTLLEKRYEGRHNLGIDTDVESIAEIQKRMDAASRALGIANRLRDPEYKKKHLSMVLSSMNTIRAALQHAIKQAEESGDEF